MKDIQKIYDELFYRLREKHITAALYKVNPDYAYAYSTKSYLKDKNFPKELLKTFNTAAEKKAAEDARFVLPNACETKIVVSMNIRSLLHFFYHRCCERAQWEIRSVAHQMLEQVKPVAPNLFRRAGRPCLGLGYCPENKMQCDRFKDTIPTHNQLLQHWKEHRTIEIRKA